MRRNSHRCTPARDQGLYQTGLVPQKEDVAKDIQKYWPIGNELAMIDGVAIKGK